jgi:SAM-dependent methyltransferase
MAGTAEAIREFWELASCGTTVTTAPKHSRDYYEDVERFRYEMEPFIHSFAQFSRWLGKRVLEVGVGAGTDFIQFALAGAKVAGVDLTDEAVENVRHRLSVYGLEAESVQQCNAEKLPFPNDSFDLVWSWGVIHHAENMEAVLAEIHRVTKPGGTIKLMVYNTRAPYAWYMYLRHAFLRGRITKGRRWAIYEFHGESFATKAYTPDELRTIMRAYPHRDLRFHFWDQKVSDDMFLAGPRRLLYRLIPRSMGWYLGFEFEKAGSGEVP